MCEFTFLGRRSSSTDSDSLILPSSGFVTTEDSISFATNDEFRQRTRVLHLLEVFIEFFSTHDEFVRFNAKEFEDSIDEFLFFNAERFLERRCQCVNARFDPGDVSITLSNDTQILFQLIQTTSTSVKTFHDVRLVIGSSRANVGQFMITMVKVSTSETDAHPH
jgi:hypothetical protein